MKVLNVGVVDTKLLEPGETLLALVAPTSCGPAMGMQVFYDSEDGRRLLSEMHLKFHEAGVETRVIRLTVLPVSKPVIDFDYDGGGEGDDEGAE